MQPSFSLSRLGTESAFQVLARAEALRRSGREVISLAIGQPDFATPAHVVEAAVKAMRDGAHGYTPANGILPLREAIAADLQRRHGRAVDPERLLVVPGGKVTMFFAFLALVEPGCEVIYPDPGFPIYRSLIDYCGARPVPLALTAEKGFAADPEALAERITDKTRLIVLNSPGNPTGGVTGPAATAEIARIVAANPQVALLSDEIYSLLLYDNHRHSGFLTFPELDEQLILLDGFSKSYAMTGWRLGYGFWPRRLIEGVTRLAINAHSCVNAATQWAGIAALDGPQDFVRSMQAAFARRRRLIIDGLNAIPGVQAPESGGAFYAFASICETGWDDRALEGMLLEEAGIATLAGSAFGACGTGHLRLSYAASEESIAIALERMRAYMSKK
ncbi:MAG: pyridoxal phosphate-dependent aminotransferase [Rhodospirillales bacterium]|nr:pyridoxal phosphate-dependent aminotransferase [Rhodospirillales bacterium]